MSEVPAQRPGDIGGAGLEVLVRQLHDAVAFIDPAGRVLLTNRAQELPARRRSLGIADLGDAFHIFRPDGRLYQAMEWPVLRSVTTGEVIVDEEFFRIAADGRHRSFSCNSAPYYDNRGRIVGAVIVARDITERKREEDALREANARIIAVLESSPDEFIAFDRDWRYLYVNGAALRAINNALGTSLTSEDLVGKTVLDLFPGFAGTDLHRQLEQSRAERRSVRLETYSETGRRWIEVRAFAWNGGLGAFTRDTSKERAAAEELRYHASLLDNVEDGVIATDAEDFRITAWNRGAELLYGYAAREVVGRPAREVATFPGDQARVTLERELLARGRSRIEFTARRKDGSFVEVELIAAAVSDARGQTSGYLGIHRDVAQRRRAARALEMRARQQALVAELTLRNLAADDLHGLMDDAVTLVARTLELELSFIAELLPGGEALSWRAAFGWSKDAIARAAPSPASARSLVGYTLLADRPVVSEDVRADERFQNSSLFAEQDPAAAVAVVIPGESQRYGVLVAASRQTRVFTAGDVDFMQAVANVIGVAVERERITERMGEVRESERRRVARELHDEGLRELTEALGLATIARSSATDPAEVQRWAAVTVALQRVGQQLRSAVYDLRLGSHEELPFAELLGDMVEIQSAVVLHCEVQLIGQASLSSGSLGHRGAEVLRILREAITNACRHSGATIVQVSAGRSTSDRLRLDVTDDGDWPDRDATVSGRLTAGIIGMYERADELGAELRIERGRGGGTTVSLDLPLGGA